MNPLDPIFDAYSTARDALKVVSRCATSPDVDEDRPFRRTRFHNHPEEVNLNLLSAARAELDDLTVLSLYATFENCIREHVAGHGQRLQAAAAPTGFESALRARFEEWASESFRMDHAVKLFESAVGEDLIGQIGQVRVYRHWIAHGRGQGPAPPSIEPIMVYKIVTAFLVKAGLVQE